MNVKLGYDRPTDISVVYNNIMDGNEGQNHWRIEIEPDLLEKKNNETNNIMTHIIISSTVS